MILRRLGNKQRLAKDILKHFPKHSVYVEPFFGAGGMFFNKPKAPHNILNDIDNDVYNLFKVIRERQDEFIKAFEITPYHNEIFQEWKQKEEEDPIWKAVRFVYLSNYGFLGKSDTMKIDTSHHKKMAIENFYKTIEFLKDCSLVFTNADFRKAIKQIAFRDIENVFIYADPPYLGTVDNYSHSFTKQDFIDLLDILQDTGCKFAVSEYNNEFVLQQAKERNLNVFCIGERQSLKNRNTEILITNYLNYPTLF